MPPSTITFDAPVYLIIVEVTVVFKYSFQVLNVYLKAEITKTTQMHGKTIKDLLLFAT